MRRLRSVFGSPNSNPRDVRDSVHRTRSAASSRLTSCQSAASFLLATGTHTKAVQEHLGHSSYAITADTYSHVAPAQAREAADRLDAAIDW